MPGPHASTPRGSPNIRRALSLGSHAATMEHTVFWHRHQAVLPSALAIVSITRTKVGGSSSPPPSERGSNMRNMAGVMERREERRR